MLGLFKHAAVDAAVHQKALGAEHLGHLGQDGGAAPLAQHIREAADGGVGGDAGQAVRTAALHAHHQLGHGDGLPLELAGVFGQFFQQFAGGGELVLHVLADQELDPVGVVLAQLGLELVGLDVLAAQVQHQHAGRVGVADQGRQQLAGLGVVMAGLAAPEGVREGVQAVDAAGDQILVILHHLLGVLVDTAHHRDDPDLVADGRPAVLAAEAHKGLGLHPGQGGQIGGGVIGILHLAREVGLDVVGVHPAAGLGVLGGMADGETVFDDVLPCLDGLDRHLMALGDIFQGGHRQAVGLHQLPLGDGVQRDHYVVDGADMNCLRHSSSPRQLFRKLFFHSSGLDDMRVQAGHIQGNLPQRVCEPPCGECMVLR